MIKPDIIGVVVWKQQVESLDRALCSLLAGVRAEGLPAIEEAWNNSPARAVDVLGPWVRVGLVEHRPNGPGPEGMVTIWLEQAAYRPWERGPEGEDGALIFSGTDENGEEIWRLDDPRSQTMTFTRPMSAGPGVFWMRESVQHGPAACSWINTGTLRGETLHGDDVLGFEPRAQLEMAIKLSSDHDPVAAKVFDLAIEWIDAGGEVFVHPGDGVLS